MSAEQLMNDARRALMIELGVRQSPGDGLYPMSARAVETLRGSVRDMLHHLEQESEVPERTQDDRREAARALRDVGRSIAPNPIDGEREAMRRIVAEGSYSRSPRDLPYQDVADRLVAAGFGLRRSEVPEPSAEQVTNAVHAALAQHGHRFGLNRADERDLGAIILSTIGDGA